MALDAFDTAVEVAQLALRRQRVYRRGWIGDDGTVIVSLNTPLADDAEVFCGHGVSYAVVSLNGDVVTRPIHVLFDQIAGMTEVDRIDEPMPAELIPPRLDRIRTRLTRTVRRAIG
ncbi:hypothetical protein HH308_09650 [Gordonia sp. TBRC 11910]|uniref:Uncharacterized protein n=1 Tax=Gordonia asplenii TaxID=2725283 RepID=A0A848KX90_9ACTN|nr:hypothetical protein [Gordonia asplenii]NMO01475.1 hypothetical protein [Gordonia asplenii]